MRLPFSTGSLAIVWSAAALLAACSDGGSGDVVERRIGPDGGQVSSHDGVLTILFDKGALTEEIDVRVFPSDEPPDAFGPAYRVQPDIPVAVPIEVTFRLDLPSEPEMATVGAIHRADFESGRGVWTSLPRIELDTARGVVTSVDTELSLYYTLLDEGGPPIGGSETGDDTTSGEETTEDPTDDETTDGIPSYAEDIQPIWDDNCLNAGCHNADASPGSALHLQGDAYDRLIEQPSVVASVPYVTPSSAEESYLMHKLDGTHALDASLGGCGCNGSGNSMPAGTDQLSTSVRNRIRTWIEQGAPR